MNKGNKGWFKHWRSLSLDLPNPKWEKEPYSKREALVDLMGLANYEVSRVRRQGQLVSIQRGQVNWSQEKLFERWNWSKGKVQSFIKTLVDEEWVHWSKPTIESKTKSTSESTSKPIIKRITPLLTITNYEKWQGVESTTEPKAESKNDSLTEPIKEDIRKSKKRKKYKKEELRVDGKRFLNDEEVELFTMLSEAFRRSPEQPWGSELRFAWENARRQTGGINREDVEVVVAYYADENVPLEKVARSGYWTRKKLEKLLENWAADVAYIRNWMLTPPDEARDALVGRPRTLEDYYEGLNKGTIKEPKPQR